LILYIQIWIQSTNKYLCATNKTTHTTKPTTSNHRTWWAALCVLWRRSQQCRTPLGSCDSWISWWWNQLQQPTGHM
jgi:hypothetical protein